MLRIFEDYKPREIRLVMKGVSREEVVETLQAGLVFSDSEIDDFLKDTSFNTTYNEVLDIKDFCPDLAETIVYRMTLFSTAIGLDTNDKHITAYVRGVSTSDNEEGTDDRTSEVETATI